MKTFFQSLLVAFSLTLTSVAVSQAEPHKPIGRPKQAAAFQSGIYTTTEGKLQISLDKETGGVVEVRLVNRAGTEFFSREIGKRQQTARLRLDVSALPDGIYEVILSNGVETTTKVLTVGTNQPRAALRLVALN